MGRARETLKMIGFFLSRSMAFVATEREREGDQEREKGRGETEVGKIWIKVYKRGRATG